MPGILRSHMYGLKKAYILGIAFASMMFVVPFGNKWHNLKDINAAKAAIENEKRESTEKETLCRGGRG